MSPTLQVKLLRVLQDGTFEPVGSSETQQVDVRIVAATNQDLERAIEEKRFREDLFYRLNVIPVVMPPLRERPGDIPLLVKHFVERFSAAKAPGPCTVSDEAQRRLASHRWPGNVRELENLMERLVVMCGEGEIGIDDLPDELHGTPDAGPLPAPHLPEGGLPFHEVVGEFETDLILQALERTHWNKNQAAKLLGMNRTTLLEKIKKKGLSPDQGR